MGALKTAAAGLSGLALAGCSWFRPLEKKTHAYGDGQTKDVGPLTPSWASWARHSSVLVF